MKLEMKTIVSVMMVLAAVSVRAGGNDYPLRAADLTAVKVTGGFWLPRVETNRLVTLKVCFDKCNETPRIANFTNAANRAWGTFGGIPFDDSDVFKVMEGAAYVLAQHPDPKLEAYMDWLISQVARAQEPDGYLYTARTLGFTYKSKKDGHPTFGMMGPTRWSNCPSSHELYNVGHMYEAAVAWQAATGKRNFLDVARKSADLVARTFGPGENQLQAIPGHEEIELALVKLYRATGEKRYLELAKHFIDRRGAQGGDKRDAAVFTQAGDLVFDKEMTLPGAYAQNHIPLLKQTHAVGHAVRAGYLYCGLADIAALTGEAAYRETNERIWENVVSKKLHLNGGIGARHKGEAFGADYELPNETAYLETCAAIANVLWNERLFLTTGEAKYVDVMERALYNGFLSGVSLGGDEFFYPNPLASTGGYKRSKWFGCSCCPVNDVRFIPQIPRFAYATCGDAAYVNLFVESDVTLKLSGGAVKLSQKTAYPWQGASALVVTPVGTGRRFALHVRVPGWCVGRPVASDLYVQTVPGTAADFAVKVNGEPFAFAPEKGYCVIDRAWKAGDRVEVAMNMPVRRIKAHDAVAADRGRLAVERGPIVYCAEGVDNGGNALGLAVPSEATFAVTTCDILGNVFPALETKALRVRRGLKSLASEPATAKLVPYFAWCHRGAGEMQTWFPTTADEKLFKLAFDVKTSVDRPWPGDSVKALCDGAVPAKSDDYHCLRCTFWPHKGTDEWVSYAFPAVETLTGVEVMWFDDVPRGGCNLPASWRVEVRESPEAAWVPVEAAYPIRKDELVKVDFAKPVKAREIRLAVQLQPNYSAGILEWKVR